MNTDWLLPTNTDCILAHRYALKLNIVADELVAIAYVLIPMAIAFLVYRLWPAIKSECASWLTQNAELAETITRRGKRLPVEFSLFILLCGSTHHFANVELYHHNYELLGYLKCLTAIVSLAVPVEVFVLALLFRRATKERLRHGHNRGSNNGRVNIA